jgi:hypothetical protein
MVAAQLSVCQTQGGVPWLAALVKKEPWQRVSTPVSHVVLPALQLASATQMPLPLCAA